MTVLRAAAHIGELLTAPVILGCGSIGGIGTHAAARGGGISPAEAYAVMDRAVDLGITVFDTADEYGGGESERAIGSWLADRAGLRAEGISVVTKVGVDPKSASGANLTPARIATQARQSRARLGLVRLPLYLVHQLDVGTPVEDSLRAFDGLYHEGVIASIGLCNVDLRALQQWQGLAARQASVPITCVQNEYNLLHRADERELIPYCAAAGIAYTAYSPLSGGILAGRYSRGQAPPPRSRVAVMPEHYLPRLDERVFDGLDQLSEEASRREISVAGLSLAWVLSRPGVTAALAAPRTPAQLDAVVEAATVVLDGEQQDRLASWFRR